MKTLLLSACAAVVAATAAVPASADPFTMNGGASGSVVNAGESRYYDDDGPDSDSWRYQSPGYDDGYGDGGQDYRYDSGQRYGYRYGNGYGYGDGYGYGNGGYRYGYGNYAVVPPHALVRQLHHSGFSYVSQPVLAGRFYQVKARDPNGRKVKLYIDAYNGRIVKVKH